MVLGDFLADTRRRWKKALKLLTRSQHSKSLVSPRHNRVSPARDAGGSIDARADITLQRFCRCSAPPALPPPRAPRSPASTYENLSYCSDSAYDTDGSGADGADAPPAEPAPRRLSYATVTYVLRDAADRDDASSITTELTWLEVDVATAGEETGEEAGEDAQNVTNERIELMTSL